MLQFENKIEEGNTLKINDPDFDKNYVKLTVEISKEEINIKNYISQSYESMSSIEQKIKLYKKFKNIFERPSLKKDLQTYYEQIVESYRENVLMDIKATVLNSNMTN